MNIDDSSRPLKKRSSCRKDAVEMLLNLQSSTDSLGTSEQVFIIGEYTQSGTDLICFRMQDKENGVPPLEISLSGSLSSSSNQIKEKNTTCSVSLCIRSKYTDGFLLNVKRLKQGEQSSLVEPSLPNAKKRRAALTYIFM